MREYLKNLKTDLKFLIDRLRPAHLRKKINLKFLFSLEIIYSFSSYFYKHYFERWASVPLNEIRYLQKNFDIKKIKKIVLIGAGAIPYTAIVFNKIIGPEIFVIIEKSRISLTAASRLLKRLSLTNCKLVRANGEDYSEYDDSLVILTLQATGKQMIADKILNKSYKNILIIRQPLGKGRQIFEHVSLNGFEPEVIKQGADFESIVLANKSYGAA